MLRDVWRLMLMRCQDHTNKTYGGRGIRVCDDWQRFEVFQAWAISNGYQLGLTLDRKDNDLGYCPENCRWITQAEQNNNKRNNRHITAFGETKTVAQWVADSRCHVLLETMLARLNRGWASEKAISTPSLSPGLRRAKRGELYRAFGENKSLWDWARDPRAAVGYGTLSSRVRLPSRWFNFEHILTTPCRFGRILG